MPPPLTRARTNTKHLDVNGGRARQHVANSCAGIGCGSERISMRIAAALDSPSDHSSSLAHGSIEDDSAVRDNLRVVGLRSPSSNVNV